MARQRALDHDDKRRAILEHSADLFARHGCGRASLNMLAAACGMSKALLYHHYADKSELLFGSIRTRLEHLLVVTNLPDNEGKQDPRRRLMHLAGTLLETCTMPTADACGPVRCGNGPVPA